jgi:tripeptidyl-peptidase-2
VREKAGRTLLTLVAVLAITQLIPVRNAYGAVDDLDGHWAEVWVEEARASGLVRGYPDGSVRPDASITRAECATLIVRSIIGEGAKGSSRAVRQLFTDLDAGHWAGSYFSLLGDMGVVLGDSQRRAWPEAPATRAEAFTMMARAFEATGYVGTEADVSFLDANEVPAWAAPSIRTLVALDVVRGDPEGTVRPNENLSRAEAVVLMLRAADVLGSRWDLEGIVGAVDSPNSQLLIDVGSRRVTVLLQSEGLFIRHGVSRGGIDTLEAGRKVRVLLDGETGLATFIEIAVD